MLEQYRKGATGIKRAQVTNKRAAALLAKIKKEMDHPREADSVKRNALAHRLATKKKA